ncbi:MAG: sulfite exporter TauE/SafE family protein [Anaerolineae bacterium]|nr:sulfite exporter TauE/SafE family protein [Anaerolineae bacterium]
MDVSIGVAFIAGLASFLAPCVLPLVPAYLGYLSGWAVPGRAATKSSTPTLSERFFVAAHAVAFVIGFSLVFILLGTAAGSLGKLLRGDWVRYLGGLLIIFFGLALMELLHVPFLQNEARLQWRGKREWGFFSSVLIGMVFAAGWTPCVGPALSAILILSADQATVGRGVALLVAYSAGIGLPFILAGFLIDRLGNLLQRISRYLPTFQKTAGAILVLVGIILITDSFSAIGLWLEQRGIGWNLGI